MISPEEPHKHSQPHNSHYVNHHVFVNPINHRIQPPKNNVDITWPQMRPWLCVALPRWGSWTHKMSEARVWGQTCNTLNTLLEGFFPATHWVLAFLRLQKKKTVFCLWDIEQYWGETSAEDKVWAEKTEFRGVKMSVCLLQALTSQQIRICRARKGVLTPTDSVSTCTTAWALETRHDGQGCWTNKEQHIHGYCIIDEDTIRLAVVFFLMHHLHQKKGCERNCISILCPLFLVVLVIWYSFIMPCSCEKCFLIRFGKKTCCQICFTNIHSRCGTSAGCFHHYFFQHLAVRTKLFSTCRVSFFGQICIRQREVGLDWDWTMR